MCNLSGIMVKSSEFHFNTVPFIVYVLLDVVRVFHFLAKTWFSRTARAYVAGIM